MQRIDENTYIDDTLVTCAEYQLFIDEMRKQGKYYQPDHWTSYQFTEGQARTPITGVRFSDAKAFCKWLTRKKIREWSFRLPTFSDTELYPLTTLAQSPLGYWTDGLDKNVQFTWVGPIPVNPRGLNIDINRELAIAFSNDRTTIINLVSDFLARPHNTTRFRDEKPGIYTPRVSAHDFMRTIFRDLFVRPFARSRIHSQDFTHPSFLDLDKHHNSDLDKYRDIEHKLGSNLGSKLTSNRTPKFVYSGPSSSIYLGSFHSLDYDIYTLQERIAGRSPAFEGIRLVKERIR